MINKNKDRGITLVALVITIIILLILATISIQSLTNTGLFAKAKEAKEKTQNAEENQAKTLNEYEDELNKYISGDIKTPVKKVADNIGSVLSTTDNTKLKDAYGNKIVVPSGFKIVSDDTTNNAQTVDKGIVIEDATVDSEGNATATNGSQFIWVPVGTIYTDEKRTDTNKKTIELNRYTFDEYGNPTAQDENIINSYWQELEISNKGNTVAKSISNFKISITTNGGYYVGRYEARTISKRTASGNELTQITEKGTDQVYNYVTQLQAAQLAQRMYDSNKFTSDLTNSYAWDTATLFLQTCGNNSIPYSRQNSLNAGSVSQIGTTSDIQCNVYDMASNIWEWTTETSSISGLPCVYRGGSYYDSAVYTIHRYRNYVSASDSFVGFRPVLYINV